MLLFLLLLLRAVCVTLLHALTSSISLLEIVAHLNVGELLYVIFIFRKVRQALVVGASVHRYYFPIH